MNSMEVAIVEGIIDSSIDDANKVYLKTWISIVLKSIKFQDKSAVVIATLLIGTRDLISTDLKSETYSMNDENEEINRIIFPSSFPIRTLGTVAETRERGKLPRLVLEIEIPFEKKEIFSFFPCSIYEYHSLIEISYSEIERRLFNQFAGRRNRRNTNGMNTTDLMKLRYKLCCPFPANEDIENNEGDKIYRFIQAKTSFLEKIASKSLVVQLCKDPGQNHYSKFSIHFLRSEGSMSRFFSFCIPVLGQLYAIQVASKTSTDSEGFQKAVYSIIVSFVLTATNIIRINNVTDIIAFVTVLMTMVFAVDLKKNSNQNHIEIWELVHLSLYYWAFSFLVYILWYFQMGRVYKNSKILSNLNSYNIDDDKRGRNYTDKSVAKDLEDFQEKLILQDSRFSYKALQKVFHKRPEISDLYPLLMLIFYSPIYIISWLFRHFCVPRSNRYSEL